MCSQKPKDVGLNKQLSFINVAEYTLGCGSINTEGGLTALSIKKRSDEMKPYPDFFLLLPPENSGHFPHVEGISSDLNDICECEECRVSRVFSLLPSRPFYDPDW